jgi:minimal PKS acyl carrier protein
MTTREFSLDDLLDILVEKAGLPATERPAGGTEVLADVGLDSLAMLQLQAELQDRYGVDLPAEGEGAYTFNDIVAYVNSHGAERGTE